MVCGIPPDRTPLRSMVEAVMGIFGSRDVPQPDPNGNPNGNDQKNDWTEH
jgi:hypothetical protein